MKIQTFLIPRDKPGILEIMARPRGNDWLEDEVKTLKEMGITSVVCLLTDVELMELGLTHEASLIRSSNIGFIHIPTPDRGIPELAPFMQGVGHVQRELANDGHVAVHCRFGVGRSSLFAAAILIKEKMPKSQVWSLIGRARGFQVPDTPAQKLWLDSMAEDW